MAKQNTLEQVQNSLPSHSRIVLLWVSDRKSNSGDIYWECRCICGSDKRILAIASDLRKKTLSCGCITKERNLLNKNQIDKVQKELPVESRLTILKESSRRGAHGRILWECTCNCSSGKLVVASASNLRKNTFSCGCLFIENNRGEYGVSSANELFGNYKRNAQKRGYSFLLTKTEFLFLTKQNCTYCNQIPSYSLKKKGHYGEYVYNGVDRINNKDGYTKNNCVTCCGECNFAKGSMTEQDFKSWLSRLTEYQSSIRINTNWTDIWLESMEELSLKSHD